VVSDGVALVHAAESLGGAGGVEHGGNQRSFAGVGVAGDYKIANVGAVVNLHGRAPSSVFYRGSLGLAEQEVAGPQTASMLAAISFTTSGAGDASRRQDLFRIVDAIPVAQAPSFFLQGVELGVLAGQLRF